jgi:hypothetical protein
MIEDYSENQIGIMLSTFLSTCSDDELVIFYDAFFGEEEDFDAVDVTIMTEEELEELWTSDFADKYSDDELFELRESLKEVMVRDFNGDMHHIPEAMSWIFGLEYVETKFKDEPNNFVYSFEDGVYPVSGSMLDFNDDI